ncbi:MAG TPA: class II fructose-bisphosphate aldolase [Candidatus Eisenbergiella merdigallinarum]|uniref:Class II fructose-bisphosphate aldolase n=1 Tax=Candidatus Eisenbergiella merdigallinarum TaxID=2838552 RepID=A0A9D2SDF1_9FIRM|nr:class II fructose-bisphosphate aldolase [Candidatus Eisenbergiella merdigallinarum]
MPLTKVKDLLVHAQEHGYGVPAINVFDYNSIKFAAMAAEEARMPLIIQYFPGFDVHAPLADIRDIAVAFARRAAVPIAVHLDHSRSFEIAVSGLGAGFPSVMVDGSALPYEENVSLTAEVARCAHAMGVDVEAELGHVGVGMNLEDMTDAARFTDPDQAVDFVSRTGADSLAIAVGNAHGNYIRTPELDFDRIRKLREVLDIPLVMHGGSDIPDDQLARAVRCGMSKFNIATEYQRAFYNNMKEFFADGSNAGAYFKALRAIERPCIDFVKSKIDVLNPDGYRL